MANGEGFKLAIIFVLGFMLFAAASMAMVAMGRTDAATLKDLFTSLGVLAAMLGIPGIISSWVVTRGQSSE